MSGRRCWSGPFVNTCGRQNSSLSQETSAKSSGRGARPQFQSGSLRIHRKRPIMSRVVRDGKRSAVKLALYWRGSQAMSRRRRETADQRWPEPLPEALPWGVSQMDRLDRKSLIKRWLESERSFGYRSHEELVFYNEKGYWPEQRMRPSYSCKMDAYRSNGNFQPEGEDQHEKH
jgi:hypothetical protein